MEKKMRYDGNVVGPRLRELRKSKKMTLDKASEMTGLSISTLKQLEQGGRRLSIASMYLLMDAYQCDANTLLNVLPDGGMSALDLELEKLPTDKKEKCRDVFGQVIKMILESGGQSGA